MKINKHPDIQKIDCECGCQFVPTVNSTSKDVYISESLAYCKCPYCERVHEVKAIICGVYKNIRA